MTCKEHAGKTFVGFCPNGTCDELVCEKCTEAAGRHHGHEVILYENMEALAQTNMVLFLRVFKAQKRATDAENLKREAAEQETSNEKRKREEQQNNNWFFHRDSLPRLGRQAISSNKSNSTALPVKIKPGQWSDIENIEHMLSRPLSSGGLVWPTAQYADSAGLGLGNYSSEAEIAGHVKIVIIEVLASLGNYKPQDVQLYQESPGLTESLTQLRPDIWVVRFMGRAAGVIEVKKPNNKEPKMTEHAGAAGQLYDYMLMLKHFFGVEHVFGILTTYNEWRIFWLPENNDQAAASTLPQQPQQPQQQQQQQHRIIPTWDHPNNEHTFIRPVDTINQATQNNDSREREVYAGETVMWNEGRKLMRSLASVILKMTSSPFKPTHLLSDNHKFIVVKARPDNRSEGFVWSRLTKDFRGIQLSNFVSVNYNGDLILIFHLGQGATGTAWLAATLDGQRTCVLKFTDEEHRQSLEHERGVWQLAWQIQDVRVATSGRKPVLIMPYVKMCSQSDQSLPKEEAKAAITRLAQAGFWHKDLEWRHIGLIQNDGILQAVIIDHDQTVRIEANDEQEAINHMKTQLGLQ